jgi:Kef-type K+ transport system membrane component KefB
MVAAETRQRHTLEKQLQPITALLVPFFFVVTGGKVNLGDLGSASALIALLIVTLLAIAGKVLGCGGGAASLGRKSALIVGVGMVPRGEVGIIVASLGLQAGVFSGTMYTLIIAMSLLTSVIAPPVLSLLLADKSPEPRPLRAGGPGNNV